MEDNLCTSRDTGMLDVHRAECQPQNVDGEWWVDDAIMPIPWKRVLPVASRRVGPNNYVPTQHDHKHHDSAMESPHPEERPLKKRRFFTEDSSPAQPRSKRLSPRPQTPPPAVDDHAQVQVEDSGVENEGAMDGFDIGMLQAVVGELSLPTLQKLKDVSGNNVERGMHQT